MAWSEDRIHRWLVRQTKPAILRGSMGHDAAVLARSSGRVVICTDQVVSGVHFGPDVPARAVGRKAVARAFADLAATASSPKALTLAVKAPDDTPERTIRDWIRGVREAATLYGSHLVGGDLACSPGPACLAVTALGEYPPRGTPPGRDRARPGDAILLTGPVGGSRLGRHLKPPIRIEAGRLLHFKYGARALMDVSDGLAWDLFRLCRSSGVKGTLIDIPIHPDAVRASKRDGLSALSHALHDGEDHELIAVGPSASLRLALTDHTGEMASLQQIGTIGRGAGLHLDARLTGRANRKWSPSEGGWRHGV